ncbi:MAG: class I SAM-dependent methyltransferase [Acidimicrobiales bacterium]
MTGLTAVELDSCVAAALTSRLSGTNLTVVCADATRTAPEGDRFWSVVSFSMLHHVAASLRSAAPSPCPPTLTTTCSSTAWSGLAPVTPPARLLHQARRPGPRRLDHRRGRGQRPGLRWALIA